MATENTSMDKCPPGTPLELQSHLEAAKKKSFKKKAPANVIIRIGHHGKNFGRLVDEEARVFVPLIHEGLIRITMEMFDTPMLISFPIKFKTKMDVYLSEKAITDPIV